MRIEPLDAPFGCAVHDLDLSTGLTDAAFRDIAEALYAHRVLVIKNQTCGKDAYLAFGRRWGQPIPHVVDQVRMPGYPEMLTVGNTRPAARDPGMLNSAAFWHTDQSYDADIATATMLYARKIPDVGGETRIADMRAAYDDLDADTKTQIRDLTALHFYGATSGRDGESPVGRLSEEQAARVPPVPHPLVHRHSITGEPVIYAVAGTAYAIEGMPDVEAEALIRRLKTHVTQPKYVYEHKYTVGDIAIWDTQMTLHSAKPIDLPNGPGTERELWRISVRGKPPIYQ